MLSLLKESKLNRKATKLYFIHITTVNKHMKSIVHRLGSQHCERKKIQSNKPIKLILSEDREKAGTSDIQVYFEFKTL